MTDQAARRPGTRALAWGLAGLVLLVLAGALVLLAFNARVMAPSKIGAYGFATVAVVVYAGVGGLIAARVPGNAIGWLLTLEGLLLAVSMFLEQYGLRGLATAPGSLPAVRPVSALGSSTQNLAVASLIVLVLLFPDGRLPSRRWRPVLWIAIAAVIVSGLGQFLQRGTVIQGSLTNALSAAHVAFPNPFGVLPRTGWYSDLLGAGALIGVAAALLALASVFVRRRGASAELRQQLAWLAYVGALTLGFGIVMILFSLATGDADTLILNILFVLAFGTPIFGIPIACAVAVLRYRLYDLDVVVKKTVVAAVLAATFTAVYVLVVVGVGAVTGHPGGSPLTFTAAALAAVLLQPVRVRAGQLADRLVYGRRATPYEVLSEFSGQIAGTYSTEDVLPRMARMLVEATGARRAEVWLRTAGSEQLEAAWPSANGSAHATAMAAIAAPGGPEQATTAPASGADASAPQTRESAGGRDDGIARAFVVEHQGERLVALRITLGLARQVAGSSPQEADELLAQTEQEAQDALEELRDLARGIYPPLLADLGLAAALEAQARKAALPVTVEAPDLGRYSQDVEAAVYFCVLEALQNAAKYAQAGQARVTLGHDGRALTFTVGDDGRGFDQAATPMGTGVQGMADRLAALGGTLRVTSAPGHGTQVTGRVPVAQDLPSRELVA
jgi:signal transduction histidine kinase